MTSRAGRWTAIIPFKPPGNRKTRLAEQLAPQERDLLAEVMFRHVIDVLIATDALAGIIVLSSLKIDRPHCRWQADHGRGLNTELEAARESLSARNLIIIHADLPLLTPDDVNELAARAANGCAIAPDRHNTGTNALAITAAMPFSFAFGAQSFQQHIINSSHKAAIVHRPGLALDIDTSADLANARAQGFAFATVQAGA